MKKVIIFKNGIETLDFFSKEIAKTLSGLGHEIFVFDLYDQFGSLDALKKTGMQDTVLLTFNFHGLGEEVAFFRDGKNDFWDGNGIKVINIMVDHPLYYHDYLENSPKNAVHFNVDRYHAVYSKKMFPDTDSGHFLPLAGTILDDAASNSQTDRNIDIVFTGNYTESSYFDRFITRINDEYTAFYRGIIDELLSEPHKTLEEVALSHMLREGMSEEELKIAMPSLNFIDLYVRFYEREQAVKALTESGLKVSVVGLGWEKLKTNAPENLEIIGHGNTEKCLEALSRAKVSLNVMPWFKAGAHDRVFSSLLNGAACITDDSEYLREIFTEGRDICFFDTRDLKTLTAAAEELLTNKTLRENIASLGYEISEKAHTWAERAQRLNKVIEQG